MYPVNDYLIIEEVNKPKPETNSTTVLYRPPTDSSVREYTVLDISTDRITPSALIGDTVVVRVKDVEDFVDDKQFTTFDKLIAVQKCEENK